MSTDTEYHVFIFMMTVHMVVMPKDATKIQQRQDDAERHAFTNPSKDFLLLHTTSSPLHPWFTWIVTREAIA